MTSINEKDYMHSNARGNGPAKRMEGGDQTDDIEINDPNTPLKQQLKRESKAQAIDNRIKNLPTKKPV